MQNRIASRWLLCLIGVSLLLPYAGAQVFTLTREQMVKYTSQNPYDRFPDGRPKVPDSVLKQLETMSSEEVMGGRNGFVNQFVDSLQLLHPGKKLIGRAFTLQLMPTRPDVADVDAAEWKAKGNAKPFNHQTALDLLQPGDVFVVDASGLKDAGGIIGDNLAFYIWKKTGTGFVIDGAIRDLEGIAAFDMAGYFRYAVPPAIRNVMVTGINVPVRIGSTTVFPGDVVFGDREGVNFIPPHVIQQYVDAAAVTHVHDDWTRKKFEAGTYRSTDIYSTPSDPALIREYEEYLKKANPKAYEEYLKRPRPGQPPAAPKKP
jgi:4-hydroxy-4-methyl-2-oxoglutarate aldolase